MSTEENGSLGLTKKAIIKLLNTAITNIDLKAGLTDEQVLWIKDKMVQIELWKDIAVTKFADMDIRLATLETEATQFQTALVNLTARVKALESKIT